MHIVFLSHEYPLWAQGGIGTFLQTFGRTLVSHGHQVTVIGVGVSRQHVQLEDEGVRLHRLPATSGLVPAFIHDALQVNRALKALHERQPVDIIESAESGLAFVSTSCPAPKVIRLHGGHHFFAEAERRPIDWRKGLLERRSFTHADAFIAVSEYVRSHTQRYLDFDGKPVATIRYPIDTSRPGPSRRVNPNKVLFAGRVCEKKGVRQLIQAFGIVRQRHPHMELDIFGRDSSVSGSSYVQALKETLDSSSFDHVVFHGAVPRDELYVRYAEAACCVFPSHMETQGLVCLEAMLCGRPVVFSKYGPGPETIDHLATGLLCDAYDPADIAAKIIWCIEHPDEAEALGDCGRQAVRRRHDSDDVMRHNLQFYASLLRRGRWRRRPPDDNPPALIEQRSARSVD